MMFTTSDVASVAESLSRWELGEYISEGFVVVAGAGELVADFGRNCLTRAHRDRVERLSTILLVMALLASLICLERANVLSGILIGSIRDKAVEAATKAQSALDKSALAENKAVAAGTVATEALGKSKAAEDASGRAIEKSNEANTAALNALGLARGTEEKLAWRRLDEAQKDEIGARLKHFRIHSTFVTYLAHDEEAKSFATDIISAMRHTNWNVPDPLGLQEMYEGLWDAHKENMVYLNHGVVIISTRDRETHGAADVLRDELIKFGFDAARRPTDDPSEIGVMSILAEPRPSGLQGAAKLRAEKRKRKQEQSSQTTK